MISLKFLHQFIILLAFIQSNLVSGNDEIEDLAGSQGEQIQSPMLEVLMHLPNKFRNVQSFKSTLGIKSERLKRKMDPDRWKREMKFKKIVDVRSYEIARPDSMAPPKRSGDFKVKRSKREAEIESGKTQALLGKQENIAKQDQGTILPIPDALRGPIFSTFPVKEFDIVDMDDPDDPRRRRNDSSDNQDDNSQRDKRTFMEAAENGESTTSLPFWKRKKENPPFITGRASSVQKGNVYTPPQHRSIDNARESHSLKSLDKSVQSNEIARNNQQDNYYAATNRRAYARQSDNIPQSTPKSVYDSIDYNNNNKRNPESSKADFGRNYEEKKEPLRDNRVTHEQYNNRQFFYNPPPVYERSFYQPPYPYPTDVVGRGVEYYHRTYDPSTGRIIYYANMPEHGRSFEYRFTDPINRNFYANRPYFYDPYFRNYVPPFDYRFSSGYGRTFDYMRSGRSSSQAYSYPHQERDKFSRDARFTGGFDKGNRLREDLRNKTYIIYDADESRYPRTQYPSDGNRVNSYTPSQSNFPPPPQVPLRNVPFPQSVDYFQQPNVPFRNQYYPSSTGPTWGFNQRSSPGVTNSDLNSRPLHSPEVQLPLTTSNRALHPVGDSEKNNKS